MNPTRVLFRQWPLYCGDFSSSYARLFVCFLFLLVRSVYKGVECLCCLCLWFFFCSFLLWLQADCPFIVCMTYAFHTPDKLCFVLDLMNGGDLHYHLSQHGVFNEQEMRFYAAEVILGKVPGDDSHFCCCCCSFGFPFRLPISYLFCHY